MDIAANKFEQASLARDIMKIWDIPGIDDTEFTPSQKDELSYLAYRLAELIQAANAFNGKATQ